LDLERFMEEK